MVKGKEIKKKKTKTLKRLRGSTERLEVGPVGPMPADYI